MSQLAQTIFGQRAAFYTTSAAHTDQAVLNRLVELARPQTTTRVLDVATGTGHTAFALAPQVRDVVATDITPEMLREGRQLQAAAGLQNVEFRIADVHALPFDDEQFDLVTCRRAAHHFADLATALTEMKRVLKPGGRLVIDDRSVPEDDFVDATLNRLDGLHDRSHVREYRPSEWDQRLRAAGFAVETLEPYTRQRPLSAFTAQAEPADAAEIEAVVAALTDAQRAALNVVEQAGQIYLDHWFVLIAAVKATSEK